MSCLIPFKYDIQLYPTKTFGTRWERVRELEKWGNQIEQALVGPNAPVAADGAINIAQPGAGAARSFGRFGWQYGGVATKPAFGSYPAQATIVGFYDPGTIAPITAIDLAADATWPDTGDAAAVNQTYPDTQVFCCGNALTGPMGATPWNCTPDPSVDAEVTALQANIEQWLTLGMPATFQFTTFRIEVRGVIYGYGGFHFPQNGTILSPIENLNQLYYVYWGTAGTALTATQITALPQSQAMGLNCNGNYYYPAGTGYQTFAFPTIWGSPTFSDANTGLGLAMATPYTVTINSVSYQVYQTYNPLLSAITLKVTGST